MADQIVKTRDLQAAAALPDELIANIDGKTRRVPVTALDLRYYTEAETATLLAGKAPATQGTAGDALAAGHAAAGSHAIAQVSGLQAALDGKATTSTTIVAGAGLSGGGALTTDVSLAVDFAGSGGDAGTASTAARGDHRHAVATAEADGMMPAAAYSKLAGIEAGAQVNPPVASPSVAAAGLDDTQMMTPLGTATAIAALSPAANAGAISDSADGSKVIMIGRERMELRRIWRSEVLQQRAATYIDQARDGWVEISNAGAKTLTDLATAATMDTSAYRFRALLDLTGVTKLRASALFTSMGTSAGAARLCLVFFPQDAEPTSGSACYTATYESVGTKGTPTIPIDTVGAGVIAISGTAAISLSGEMYLDERLRLSTVWADVLHWGGAGTGDSPACQNFRLMVNRNPVRGAPWLWVPKKVDFNLTTDMGADNLVAGDPIAGAGIDNTAKFHNIMQRFQALRATGDRSRRGLMIPSGCHFRLDSGYGKITADNLTFYGTGSGAEDCGFFTTTDVTGGNSLKANQLFRFGDQGVGTLAGRTSAWAALCWHPIKAVAKGQCYVELEANPVCKTADGSASTTDTGHGAAAYAALNVGDVVTILSQDWYKSGSQAGWPSGAPEKPARRWTFTVTAKENTGGRYLIHGDKAAPFPWAFPIDGSAYRSPYRVVSVSGTEYYAIQPVIVRLSDLTTSDSSHSLYVATAGNPFYNAPIWHVSGLEFHNLTLKSWYGEVFSQGPRDTLFDRVIMHGGAGGYGNAYQRCLYNSCEFQFSGMAAEYSLNSDCNTWQSCRWVWTGDPDYGKGYDLSGGLGGDEWHFTGARGFSFQERSSGNYMLDNTFEAQGYDPSNTAYAANPDRPGAVGTGPFYFFRDTGTGNRLDGVELTWGGANGAHYVTQSEGSVRDTGVNANGSEAMVVGCTFRATGNEAMVYKVAINGGSNTIAGTRLLSAVAGGVIQVNGTSSLTSGTNTIADVRVSDGNILLNASMTEPVAIARIGAIAVTTNGHTPTYTDQTALPDFGRYAAD